MAIELKQQVKLSQQLVMTPQLQQAIKLLQLSRLELERLSRGFVQQIADFIGPETDIPAPDVYTNAMVMGWMMDEYTKHSGEYHPGVITGKPVGAGGSVGCGASVG